MPNGIARICNAAMARKARFHVLSSVKQTTRSSASPSAVVTPAQLALLASFQQVSAASRRSSASPARPSSSASRPSARLTRSGALPTWRVVSSGAAACASARVAAAASRWPSRARSSVGWAKFYSARRARGTRPKPAGTDPATMRGCGRPGGPPGFSELSPGNPMAQYVLAKQLPACGGIHSLHSRRAL